MVPLLRIEGEHRGQVNLCWEAQVILQAAGLGLVVRAVEVGVVGQGVGALLQPGCFGWEMVGISMDKKIIIIYRYCISMGNISMWKNIHIIMSWININYDNMFTDNSNYHLENEQLDPENRP